MKKLTINHRTIKVKTGKLICSSCNRQADTLHLVKEAGQWTLKAACPNHDPGGYWFRIEDFTDRLGDWIYHLHGKNDGRLAALIEGLGFNGWQAIDEARRDDQSKRR